MCCRHCSATDAPNSRVKLLDSQRECVILRDSTESRMSSLKQQKHQITSHEHVIAALKNTVRELNEEKASMVNERSIQASTESDSARDVQIFALTKAVERLTTDSKLHLRTIQEQKKQLISLNNPPTLPRAHTSKVQQETIVAEVATKLDHAVHDYAIREAEARDLCARQLLDLNHARKSCEGLEFENKQLTRQYKDVNEHYLVIYDQFKRLTDEVQRKEHIINNLTMSIEESKQADVSVSYRSSLSRIQKKLDESRVECERLTTMWSDGQKEQIMLEKGKSQLQCENDVLKVVAGVFLICF